MATAPFNPNENVPADDDIVSQFPAAERTFRDIMEDWINTEHDTSGHHKFPVITTAVRDGISDWVVGSQIYNTTTEAVEILTSTGPNVWSPAVPVNISSGAWTPVLSVGGATTGITYGTQEGRYYRVGQLVTIWGKITLTNDGSGLSGNLSISGIPFDAAPSPEIDAVGVFVPNDDETTNTGHDTWCVISANGTSITPFGKFYVDEEDFDDIFILSDATISNISSFIFSVTYVTDAA